MESDWRHFRDMVPRLRERYLAERNARIVALLTNPKKNETERFWDALEVMDKEAKVLQRCLGGAFPIKAAAFYVEHGRRRHA
jgi:hypothetical protein